MVLRFVLDTLYNAITLDVVGASVVVLVAPGKERGRLLLEARTTLCFKLPCIVCIHVRISARAALGTVISPFPSRM